MDRITPAGLRQLHELLMQMRDVQDQLERGPKQLQARRQLVVQKESDLEAQKQKHKQLQVQAQQRELQRKSNEKKLEDLKTKLNMAASNREYDAFRTQIAADEMANSVLEDEILELLDKVDTALLTTKKLEQEITAAKAEEARFTKEWGVTSANLNTRADELRRQIADCEKHLPPDIAAQYRRLVSAHGAEALASVEGGMCNSCFVQIPPQMQVTLKSGQLAFCKTCGRLLYPIDARNE